MIFVDALSEMPDIWQKNVPHKPTTKEKLADIDLEIKEKKFVSHPSVA